VIANLASTAAPHFTGVGNNNTATVVGNNSYAFAVSGNNNAGG
jgi:hypothetical protein